LPGEWDFTGRRLAVPRGSSERRKQLSEYEESMACDLQRMDSVVRELEKSGRCTLDEIMRCYRSIMSGNSLGVFAEKLATELSEWDRERTARAYRSAASRFIRFNGGQDIKLEHITLTMITDFQQSLKNERRSMNTVSFYMRMLRAIYHKAIEEGRISRHLENPFSGVYTGVSPTRKLALTPEELATLAMFNPAKMDEFAPAGLLPASLQQALALFLFCCHARGMCFVDLAYLKKRDVREGFIHYRRRKTGQMLHIRLLPSMQRILDYFGPFTAGSEYLFPIITNPKKSLRVQYEAGLTLQNQRLKKLAVLTGIDKKLSTHCARHSWATVAKGEGLPLAVISEGLGHANQKTTEIYLASLEQSVLDRASKLVSEAIDSKPHTKDTREPKDAQRKVFYSENDRSTKSSDHPPYGNASNWF